MHLSTAIGTLVDAHTEETERGGVVIHGIPRFGGRNAAEYAEAWQTLRKWADANPRSCGRRSGSCDCASAEECVFSAPR